MTWLWDRVRPSPPPDDESERQRRQFERFEREALALSEEFRARVALLMREHSDAS